MKKIHILGIVVIAVAIGVIFTSLQSSATIQILQRQVLTLKPNIM
jgi:hypothetical protein